MSFSSGLPIDAILPRLIQTVQSSGIVLLSAEPGAGKSTIVPLALLESGIAPDGRKILMLEPRVLAARAAARRMAFHLHEKPGQTVGYRTRAETLISKSTRIEVVTEAILTKMLQRDPSLENVAVVIFDEFHERSIHADLALALTLDARAALREDLKLILMSATLDTGRLKELLNDPPALHTPGNCYPVRVLYSPEHLNLPLELRIRNAVNSALKSFEGDVLVFLPGEYEIRKALSALTSAPEQDREILPLYGSLSAEEQDRIFTSHPDTVRRVILATSIAETSLTIPGIRIVIDSGLMRAPRFSPSSGMNVLETLSVTEAGAEQRRGRAGRTSPGVCIRLWRETDRLLPFPVPEILSSDLAPAALELVRWGCRENTVKALPWVDAPPDVMLHQAFSLLRDMDAVSGSGELTEHGKKLAEFPLHPRMAHAVLCGAKWGCPATASELSAIMEDRELTAPDLAVRLKNLHSDFPGTKRIRQQAKEIFALLPKGVSASAEKKDMTGILTAAAFPDRIAGIRDHKTGECTLSNGITAFLPDKEAFPNADWLAVASTSTMNGKTTIRSAAELELKDMEHYLPALIHAEDCISWDEERKMTIRETVRRIGSLTLSRMKQTGKAPDEIVLPVLMKAVRNAGLRIALEPSQTAEGFRQRVQFLHIALGDDYPDFSEEGLLNTLEDWLVPYASGLHSFAELRKLDLRSIWGNFLSSEASRKMASFAPEKLSVPSGSQIRINYEDPAQPKASVRLQELFGMESTPLLAGRVPLLIDILSPAMRTVQKTSDLHSFWRESYFLVRKDMRGRYPKHDWPEDPLSAVAHRGVKKRNG